SGRADIAGPIQAPGADKPSPRQSDIFVTASARSDNPPADSFSKTVILALEMRQDRPVGPRFRMRRIHRQNFLQKLFSGIVLLGIDQMIGFEKQSRRV